MGRLCNNETLAPRSKTPGGGMGKVILGAILGLTLGVMLGAGIKNLCEEDVR